jgi:hypothetical protein
MKITNYPLLHDPEDVKIALEAATQMAERFGEDMVIQQDLSVTTLWAAQEPPLEIVRCPAALKKNKRAKIIRMVK